MVSPRLPALLLGALIACPAHGLVLSQQGRVLSAGGAAVDGTYALTVTLYANPYTTAKLWTETQEITVVSGVFQATLGQAVPLDPLVLASPAELWIGVRVESEPELPRARVFSLSGSAAAAHARNAGGLSGPIESLDCSGCIDGVDISDAAVTGAKLAPAAVQATHTGFGWAAGAGPGGAAAQAADLECDGCVSQSDLAGDVAHENDLLFVGKLLSSLDCANGEHPVLSQDGAKKAWTCARSTTSHGMAVHDPWGYRFDGIPRYVATWDEAKAACEALGGRLPTVTELWRNNVKSGTGSLSEPQEADWLWTVTSRYKGEHMVTRLNDGAVGYYNATTGSRYRCVWPDFASSDFAGDNCNGPPGASCFAVDGGLSHIDMSDRPPLPLGAAMQECAFVNARIPEVWELEVAVRQGLPNGSGTDLWTTEPYETCWGSGCATKGIPWVTMMWSGTDPGWTHDETFTNPATASSGLYGRWHADATVRFRCKGLANRGALASAAGSYHDTAQTIWFEGKDRSGSVLFTAIDTCFGAKGHLPTIGEMWQGARTGWVPGTGADLWTGTLGDVGPITLAWVGGLDALWPSNNFKAGNTNTYVPAIARPYRCAYYPTRLDFKAPTGCFGGCFQKVKGVQRTYADGADRPAATYWQALDDCAAQGGRLPSARDMAELIRGGLPNGNQAPTWTTSTGYDETQKRIVKATARWFDSDPTWFPKQSPVNEDGFGQSQPAWEEVYRCIWTNEAR